MYDDDPDADNPRSASFWRGLARRAMNEAECSLDPQVKEVLLNIADEYLDLADRIEEQERRKS
jgi:hypothetical protein